MDKKLRDELKDSEGRIHSSDLTDGEWKLIKRYLPKKKKTGRPRANDRWVINGILYFLSTAIRWNDMPKYYPPGVTCWRRLKRWDEEGVWERILCHLQKKALDLDKLNLNNVYIDGSFAESKKGGVNTRRIMASTKG